MNVAEGDNVTEFDVGGDAVALLCKEHDRDGIRQLLSVAGAGKTRSVGDSDLDAEIACSACRSTRSPAATTTPMMLAFSPSRTIDMAYRGNCPYDAA